KHGAGGSEITVAVRTEEDGRVLITVVDNGMGIPPQDLEKIFTPFFSTKPVGQGTGLGLPICFGLVSEMGGEMSVQSEKGKGATFSIYLNRFKPLITT
ncbi:MAG: HAMP domain-containing sensor histidine kinase, partial [Thermodesulfobacteriota bacterium]